MRANDPAIALCACGIADDERDVMALLTGAWARARKGVPTGAAAAGICGGALVQRPRGIADGAWVAKREGLH